MSFIQSLFGELRLGRRRARHRHRPAEPRRLLLASPAASSPAAARTTRSSPGCCCATAACRAPSASWAASSRPRRTCSSCAPLADDGLDPQAALDRPRFRVEADAVCLEEGLWDRADELERAGIRTRLRRATPLSFGGGQAILSRTGRAGRRVRPAQGRLRGGAVMETPGPPTTPCPARCSADGDARRSWRRRTTSRLTYAQLAAAVEETRRRRCAPLGVGRGDCVAFALAGRAGVRRAPAGGRLARGRRRRRSTLPTRVRVRLLPGGPPPRLLAAAARRPRSRRGRRRGDERAGARPEWCRAGQAPAASRAPRARGGDRRGAARRRRAAAAHERHHEPAEAGAAEPPQPAGLRALDRPPLRARPRGRLVLRDAAVPRARHRRLDARAARGPAAPSSRRGASAPSRFWPALGKHGVTWYCASPTFHEMLLDGAPDEVPEGARLRFVALLQLRHPARARSTAWRSTSACRCSRPTA